jgi:hypothetical protein
MTDHMARVLMRIPRVLPFQLTESCAGVQLILRDADFRFLVRVYSLVSGAWFRLVGYLNEPV